MHNRKFSLVTCKEKASLLAFFNHIIQISHNNDMMNLQDVVEDDDTLHIHMNGRTTSINRKI